jgi:hypothetical protein
LVGHRFADDPLVSGRDIAKHDGPIVLAERRAQDVVGRKWRVFHFCRNMGS